MYCEVGHRCHTATALAQERGFQARNLDGGYRRWLASAAAAAGEPRRVIGLPL
jgi:rhodanese-related sulfurtransferase